MSAGVVDQHTITSGVLNVNKPSGWTSHDVVAKLRRVTRARRVGHAGTLDPAATGVLPVLIGKATRISEYLVTWDKAYRAVLRLGETTDTQDATGTVLSTAPVEGVTPERIRDAVARFVGRQAQTPPMYSAVKVKGEPLYRAARAGRTVERDTRPIMVHHLRVEAIDGPEVTLDIVCSKGTYVRTLCADIGDALGVGAHVRELVRTRVGPLTIEDALTIDAITELADQHELSERLLSLDGALAALPAVLVDQAAAERALHGVPVPMTAVQWEHASDAAGGLGGRTVRLKSRDGRLLGLATVPSDATGPGHAPVLAIVKVLAGS